MSEVIKPRFQRHDLGELARRIKEQIYNTDSGVSLAEVIGVIEIVKAELIEDHK